MSGPGVDQATGDALEALLTYCNNLSNAVGELIAGIRIMKNRQDTLLDRVTTLEGDVRRHQLLVEKLVENNRDR